VPPAAKKLGPRFKTSPGSSMTVLAFPTFQREFDNPKVRRAISMAIDRDAIVASLFPGAQASARSFVPPPVAGYRPDTCGVTCRYDPAAAKAAYADGGGPATLQISYNADGGHQGWVDATCAQLVANLGVTCSGSADPTFESMLEKVRRSAPVGAFRMTWFMDYPSMESYLGPLFASDGAGNYARYHNPDFDAAVRAAMTAPSRGDAVTRYQAAEDLLAQDMPVIPLRYEQNATGQSRRVKTLNLDAFGRVDLVSVEIS
jgi:oligopeptide transport system substrate-binding protein